MTMLDEIAAYLQAESVATVGTNLFKGRLPDSPDTCMALFEYGGMAPEFVHGEDAPINQRPSLQVLGRAAAYVDAESLVRSAYTALNKLANQSLSGTRYFRVVANQEPFYLRRDGNERTEFACNFSVQKEPS